MYKSYVNEDGLSILLPSKIFNEISNNISKNYPNECGGIFVGKIDLQKQCAIIEHMKMPNEIKSTPVFFKRLAAFLNNWLNDVFISSKGELFYLGEWHSHPNGFPIPSSTDLKTLRKIAKSKTLRIETPLLLIVGYDNKSYNERFFIYTHDKLIPYDKQD